MAASASEIEEFLSGPLVKWLSTCMKKPETLQVYETFFDGAPINEVLLLIDPEPSLPVPSTSTLHGLSITAARTKIFHSIIQNIKAVYEDELGQVVVSVPDCVVLGRTPASQSGLEQLKLLILLLLGCAVQGPTKELFILKIKELSVDDQHDIVECIKRVTDDQSIVLTLDWIDQAPERLFSHIRTLTAERDKLLQEWVKDLSQETISSGSSSKFGTQGVESNHLAVELADWKARMRKQRQELEEKTEILAECKEELEHATNLVAKLKAENSDLVSDARRAKTYRDEVDSMREKLERADRLEIEVQRYREKVNDTEFYRDRVSELREDNRILSETREMLEKQLERERQKGDHVLQLKNELLAVKQAFNSAVLERDATKEKVQELLDENHQLQHLMKSALQETSCPNISTDSDLDETNSGDNSLSEQLTNDAQARALRFELENKRLLLAMDSMEDTSFQQSANKILDLDKEKKKLALKCEQLQENCDKLTRQNVELEDLFKNAIQENRKLQDSIDSQKTILERQNTELNNERIRTNEIENNMEHLTKEKQRVQMLCDTIRKRADDAEKSLSESSEQLLALEAQANTGKEFEKLAGSLTEKVAVLEKENLTLSKEVAKVKETIETKDVIIDQNVETSKKLERENQRLEKENENLTEQIEKFQELEKKTQELASQSSVYTETISTLQKDLINEKVSYEKFKNNLDKLGLSMDVMENDIIIIIERLLENSEILKIVTPIVKEHIEGTDIHNNMKSNIEQEKNNECEKLLAEISSLQVSNDILQKENATLKVDVATLKSQVNSLQTQQTALQLANSQLVAEKDELVKKQKIQNVHCDTLFLDQVTLRTLHEQLSLEYEEAKQEQENLKRVSRDLRSEMRTLKEANSSLETKILDVEMEKDTLKNDAKSLGNLRSEHSKLKDDFRNLFTVNEQLKREYRAVQEGLKSLKTESRNLMLGKTEMQGELNLRSDEMASLQLENAKLHQRCEMLFEMNHSLDSDRRTLMEHVSQLLTQYHLLLTHSLEDKEQYHIEEKLYTDKVNNLCRQKEKLEEKIMEHYRKLDNTPSKKKGFGATLVRRVKKAGSDIINKVPRNRQSWHEDSTRLTQSQLTLLNDGSGESNGNNSDISAEDVNNQTEPFKRSVSGGGGSLHGYKPKDEVSLRRSSHRDLTAHRNSVAGDQVYCPEPGGALSLGSVGTRRTVYLSEEDITPVASSLPQNNQTSSGTPPLLVYNKISIGGDTQKTSPPQPPQTEESNKDKAPQASDDKEKTVKSAKETAVWYEYGCV